jgi:hypothetical protein
MGSSQSLSGAAARSILVVSHLSAVLILNYMGYHKRWAMFVFVLFAALGSIFMHLCQLDTNYGLVDENYCLVGEGTDVKTGLSLADYTTAYAMLPQFSIWGPDVTHAHQGVGTFLNVFLVAITVSVYAPGKTAPIVVAVVLVVIHWTIRLVRMSQKENGFKNFYERFFEPWSLVTGALIIVVGGVCYLLQTDDNYVYLHSTWMFLDFLGIYFLFRGLDPTNIGNDFTYCSCCYESTASSSPPPPNYTLVTTQPSACDRSFAEEDGPLRIVAIELAPLSLSPLPSM